MRWHALVPLKPPTDGKSRLRGSSDPAGHAALVRALQLDTVIAITSAITDGNSGRDEPLVALHLISPESDPLTGWARPPTVTSLRDPGGGLNAALRAGADHVAAHDPGAGVLVVLADLPSLRPADVIDVLRAGAGIDRWFVPDRVGSGSTMLAGRRPDQLDPQFGAGSAARHSASGARSVDAAETARSDVDTDADLRHCLSLGVGAETSALPDLEGCSPGPGMMRP